MTTYASQLDPYGVLGSSFPAKSSFTLVGSGGTHTYTESGNSVVLQGANTLANSIVMYEITPTVPYTYTVAIKLLGTPCATGWSVAGINFRDSATGRIHMFRTYTSNAGVTVMTSTKFTNATTYSADYLVRQVADGLNDWVHMRIADDNANRICSYSLDGYNFHTFHTIGRTDFLTANRVNFGVDLAGSAVTTTCGAAFANWRAG